MRQHEQWQQDELLRRWRAEETGHPGGWDFTALDGRVHEPAMPWDFDSLTRTALADASAVLDMGIGVVPFGQPDDDLTPAAMPFGDGRFDLVLNRHESFHPVEVARVLRPGGVFLTQQVGGDEFGEVRDLLGQAPPAPHVNYAGFWTALTDAGLRPVDRYVDALFTLHAAGPQNGHPLLVTRRRFWIIADRPH